MRKLICFAWLALVLALIAVFGSGCEFREENHYHNDGREEYVSYDSGRYEYAKYIYYDDGSYDVWYYYENRYYDQYRYDVVRRTEIIVVLGAY